MPRRKAQKEIIKEFTETHGDRYDYSLMKYVNNTTPVDIICKIHGVFPQTPKKHKAGQGCPYCAGNIRKTCNEAVKEFQAKHGNKYDYSLVRYINNITPVCIVCHEKDENGNEHGEFWQTPNNHKNGEGCPKCNGGVVLTQDNVIFEFNRKHNGKYDYSKVIYVNDSTPVCIICHNVDEFGDEHGEFWQAPGKHKHGQGCPKCAGTIKLTKDEFTRKSKLKHGNTYDYSLVSNINNNKTIVRIKCNKCGHVFEQIVNNHLNDHGCPYCKSSHLEEQTILFLERHNIKYNYQQTFDWLKSSKKWSMFLDFYLPKYNIVIECQGIQHYMSEGNGYFTTEGIKSTQQNDVLKHTLCKEHGIPIYYINYNDNVEDKLNVILTEINDSV